MRKNTAPTVIAALLLAVVMITGMAGCGASAPSAPSAPSASGAQGSGAPASAPPAAPPAAPAETPNTRPVTVVWYPNESSNTHAEVRAEVGRLIEQATGRTVEQKTTTDYTIAIESIASGSADIAMAMGAVGYIEAKNKNPLVDVLFVNADSEGKLDGAKYFSWICVNRADADEYLSGGAYTIDNIKGQKISFVSNSSTSGFRVPTSSIIAHFTDDNLTEDDLLPDGNFFEEVYFGGSHQGSAINLVTGGADAAAFCDIELAPYIELISGEENTVGAVYAVKTGADAPFDAHAGKEFVVIACTPVFNGPNAYNPQNLSAAEIKAIQDLFTSAEVTGNELLFYDAAVEGAVGLYNKASSLGYILTADSWYDPYRN
ncbi:MAG: phosphate/phosphite/phosphonate ABC transporter substrate-binding protein [Gracilibacteraceae bacterium]|jgi:phosphonate transport system substrate-binding protein|nr:phosphate/phosphite/phosphonate ABC transporter substrate-binding protein [Gracilibacteraceae bacterium]